MKKQLPGWLEPVFFIVLFSLALNLSLSFHSGKGYFNWKSEIWSDRAGYYIYLPATFYYHWDLKQVPAKMDEKTGYGFRYDTLNHKILTDNTYGISLLLSPFFIGVHFITKVFHIPQDWAFAPIYHQMANVASVFYLVLGLILLRRFLCSYVSEQASFLTVFLLFAGTGLFYYSIAASLMPPVYSFFLSAVFLFFLKKFLNDPGKFRSPPGRNLREGLSANVNADPGKYSYFLLFSLALSLEVLITPAAALMLFAVFFLDVSNLQQLKERVNKLLKPRYSLVFLLIFILVFCPQMAYWKYSKGNFISSRPDALWFTNLLTPRLPEVWFSTLNGLFIYAPLMFFIIAGMVVMIRKKAGNSWLGLGVFVLLSYLLASWWCWYSGCAYSQPLFIGFLPLFALPLAFLLQQVFNRKRHPQTIMLISLMLVCTAYTSRLSYTYEECFFGSTWDWAQFGRMLNTAKILTVKPGFSYYNDFENGAIANGATTTRLLARSGDYSLLFDRDHEYNMYYFEYLDNLKMAGKITKLQVRYQVFKTGTSATGAVIVCDIKKDGKQLYYESRPLDVPMSATRQWYAVPANFDIPANLDPWSEVRVYIWNRARTTFYVDDLEINTE
ncbi:MAG: hypothetical protein NTW31_09240 [Bacteroidetes bacterium]|nr:hypothetical protein [Bacteroidota bacterium]